MIFIALGTQKFQFNRLLKEIDKLIEENKLEEEVFAQIGHSNYVPRNYDYIKFLDKEKYDECIKKSTLLITHSGVGTIISAIKLNKPVLVFPRLKKFNEHVDDHQLEIAQVFSKKGYVIHCIDEGCIYKAIKQSKQYKFNKYIEPTDKIEDIIDDFLKKIEIRE